MLIALKAFIKKQQTKSMHLNNTPLWYDSYICYLLRILLLNVELSLDNGLPKYPRGGVYTIFFQKPKYISHIIMYVKSTAVTALLRYPEIIGIPIKLFLIPT